MVASIASMVATPLPNPNISQIPNPPQQILTLKKLIYFHSVFHEPSDVPNVDELPKIRGSLQTIVITISDVYEALISLDIDKSSGIDEISPRVLQSCAE